MRWPGVLCIAVTACGRYGFDPSTDGGELDGDPCASAFPPISSLTDDFSDGLFQPNWTNGGTCMTETGGQLVANLTPNTSTPVYCISGTLAFYRLACDAVTVHVPQAANPVVGAQTGIYFNTPTHDIGILLEGAGFQAAYDNDPSTKVGSDGYDAVADAWWRVRAELGHLYFETSPNGAAWNPRIDLAIPFSLAEVGLTLGAGTYKAVADPGTARYSCLNLPAPCL